MNNISSHIRKTCKLKRYTNTASNSLNNFTVFKMYNNWSRITGMGDKKFTSCEEAPKLCGQANLGHCPDKDEKKDYQVTLWDIRSIGLGLMTLR